MVIDGRAIADTILNSLQQEVDLLKKNGIIPKAAIILVGSDPASESYVRQKELKGELIGAKITVMRISEVVEEKNLLSAIDELNNDPLVHGIIVQRPLPDQISETSIINAVALEKDIDGFRNNSPFVMPISLAVWEILTDIHAKKDTQIVLLEWLKQQRITILGKGITGGGPIIEYFKTQGIHPTVIDSKTQNTDEILEESDIVISTVGKPNVLRPGFLKKGVILLGIGMYKGQDGKMHGDYEEEEIKNIASFYTPIPGGVGPVNVAMLMQNLIKATEK